MKTTIAPNSIDILKACEGIESFLNKSKVNPDISSEIALAVDEALTYILINGYHAYDLDCNCTKGEICIEAFLSASSVHIFIEDNAPTGPSRLNPATNVRKLHQWNSPATELGVFLLKSLMDSVKTIRIQNRNTMLMSRTLSGYNLPSLETRLYSTDKAAIFLQDEIIKIRLRHGVAVNIGEASDLVRAYRQMCHRHAETKSDKLLINMKAPEVIPKEVKEYFLRGNPFDAEQIAVVTGSSLAASINNILLGFDKNYFSKIRVFNSEREAICWLRGTERSFKNTRISGSIYIDQLDKYRNRF